MLDCPVRARISVLPACLAAVLAACGGCGGSGPGDPGGSDDVRLAMSVDAAAAVSRVVVDARGGPVAFTDTVAVDSGYAESALSLPERTTVTLSLQAYDASWVKVGEGSAEVLVTRTPQQLTVMLPTAGGTDSVAVTFALKVLRARPFHVEMWAGDTAVLRAELVDSYGSVTPVPSASWSAPAGVVGVSGGGVVAASDTGRARVLATSGGLAARAWVHVRRAPRVVAHRGFGGLFPENTLPAFRGALALGAAALETDIRLTRDSVPVLMHDETVDRTTDGHGAVASLTWAQIAAMDACERIERCAVPRLRDLLQLTGGRAQVYLEIKDAPDARKVAIILDEIARYGSEDSVVVASFSAATLALVRKANPRIRVGLIAGGFPDPAVVMPLAPVELVVGQDGIQGAPDRVAWFQSHGVPVLAWTLDRRSQAFRMQDLGVGQVVADVQLRNLIAPSERRTRTIPR